MIHRPTFSRDVRKEVTIALNAYTNRSDLAAKSQLTAAIDRVCAEALAMHLTVHDLGRGLAALYAELPGVDDGRRRDIFHYFSRSCIEAMERAVPSGTPPAAGR